MLRYVSVKLSDGSECNAIFRFHLGDGTFCGSAVSNAVLKDCLTVQTGISTNTGVCMVQKFFYSSGLVKIAQHQSV